jgi:RHS repeat-associated protein
VTLILRCLSLLLALSALNADAAVTWSSTRSLGYGPQPGSWSPPIEPGRNPLESFAWRGKYADGSGLICLHARYYDPTRGRFISPDPLGHSATPDLYSAFAGDPIDNFDPDGCLSVNTARGGWAVGADLSAKAGWGSGSGLGFEDYRLSGLDGAYAGLTVPIGALTGGAGGAVSIAGRVAYAGLGAAGGNIVTDFALEGSRGQLPTINQLHTSSTVGLLTGPAGPLAEEGLGAAYRVYNTIRSSSKPASYALGDITIQGHPAGVGPGAMYMGEFPQGEIATPYGAALQSELAAAQAARAQVSGGGTLYRVGTTGRSAAGEAQFWALEHPSTPGFAARYGIPAENVAAADFIETATLKPGTSFITRPAPGIGTNLGGGIEVVVPAGGVRLDSFHYSPDILGQ